MSYDKWKHCADGIVKPTDCKYCHGFTTRHVGEGVYKPFKSICGLSPEPVPVACCSHACKNYKHRYKQPKRTR